MTPLLLLVLSTFAWAEPASPPTPAPVPVSASLQVRAQGDGVTAARRAWRRAAGEHATAADDSIVGRFSSRADAVAFAARELTTTPLPFSPTTVTDAPAPALADAARRTHGVRVHAFSVILDPAQPWPSDPAQWLPPDSHWHRATIVAPSVPLWAAPGPRLVSAGQAHGRVERSGDVFELGHVDRCDDAGTCLRWTQIIARNGDTFVGGYVPAYLVIPREDWVPSATHLPRAQLRPSTIGRGEASWVLWVRVSDGTLHQTTLTEATSSPDRWPDASLRIEGTTAVIELGQTPRELPLDASLDARPEDL